VGLRAIWGEEWALTGVGLAVTWTAAVSAGLAASCPFAEVASRATIAAPTKTDFPVAPRVILVPFNVIAS